MTGAAGVKVHKLIIQGLSDDLSHFLSNCQIVQFALADYVVFVLRLGVVDQEKDRGSNVARMNPEARAGSCFCGVGVNQNLLAAQNAAYDKRNKLLRKLALAENVHAMRYHYGQAVSVSKCQAKLFGTGFAGGIGVAGVVSVPFLVGHTLLGRSK